MCFIGLSSATRARVRLLVSNKVVQHTLNHQKSVNPYGSLYTALRHIHTCMVWAYPYLKFAHFHSGARIFFKLGQQGVYRQLVCAHSKV